MAASGLDERYLELARSMEIASIPERIRCSTCDKLAINAVKTPCCDSAICGDCQQAKLPSYTECPICMHTPFSADMVVPAKSLQTTVKVFIKSEAKKRGIDLKTGAKIVTETHASTANEAIDASSTGAISHEVPTDASGILNQANGDIETAEGASHENADTPVASTAETQGADIQANDDHEAKEQEHEQDDDEEDDDDVVITTERPELEEHHQQHPDGDEHEQYDQEGNDGDNVSGQNMQMDNGQAGLGFDSGMAGFGNGNFNNMNMMNGFNPMMGMPGFGMGMPNMMGMPGMGMGMDPSMMFNGSFGGMGDMSMMGMGNMGGAMSGMGDFNGMGGPGFFPNQGNYMQSNYGNAHRQNFFNDRGYGRGYGRGFGRGSRGNQFGRGRGGWGYQQQNQYSQHQNQHQHQQQGGGPQQTGANDTEVSSRRRASPSYETGQGTDGDTASALGAKSSTHELSNGHNAQVETNMAGDVTNQKADGEDRAVENRETAVSGNEEVGNDLVGAEDSTAMANGVMQTDLSAHGNDPSQYSVHDDFDGRQPHSNGHSGQHFGQAPSTVDLTPAPAPPINAPTGPKAMRQGLPNTGWAGRAASQPKPTPTPAPEVKSHSDGRKYGDEGRGRSRSRSRSRHRSTRDKERDDGYESDETYARRKDRERRKRKEREERYEEEREASKDDEKRSKKYRSRSQSRTDDSSRRRHRDKDDEHRSSRSHRDRSKDKHRRRHRSRSPGKDDASDEPSRRKSKSHHDRDAEYESSDRHKDGKRSSRKHSSREDDDHYKDDRKDRSHRSSKHDRTSKSDARAHESERPRAVIEPPSDELGFKIKGSKSAKANKESSTAMAPPSRHDRRSSAQQESSTPTGPAAASNDPYAEERARAQQNREAREAQRRMSSSTSLGKRGREDDELFDAPKGPRGDRNRVKKGRMERRVNYKYEDEVGGGGDGGDERDAGRWR